MSQEVPPEERVCLELNRVGGGKSLSSVLASDGVPQVFDLRAYAADSNYLGELRAVSVFGEILPAAFEAARGICAVVFQIMLSGKCEYLCRGGGAIHGEE